MACCCCSSLSRVRLFATPWTAACQLSLSFTISWSLLKFVSIERLMANPQHFYLVVFSAYSALYPNIFKCHYFCFWSNVSIWRGNDAETIQIFPLSQPPIQWPTIMWSLSLTNTHTHTHTHTHTLPTTQAHNMTLYPHKTTHNLDPTSSSPHAVSLSFN